jgi:hypothetical protein
LRKQRFRTAKGIERLYNFRQAAKEVLSDCVTLYLTLLKILVPVMIIVRLAALTGLIDHVGDAFSPVMGLVGLPPAMGLVWATTMFLNPYSGAVVLLGLLPDNPLTSAQATVLGALMLMAHSLPLEQKIVQKAGGGLVFMTLLRIGGGLALGYMLFRLYSSLDLLQGPITISFLPQTDLRADWASWFLDSLRTLASVFFIILFLLSLMKLFELLGFNKWLAIALRPFLRFMGIEIEAAQLNLSGALLGLAFGGALIIRESHSGKLPARSIFLSLVFLCLFHGVIEDTIFVMALGAHISGALFARLAFTLIVVGALGRVVRSVPDSIFLRYLLPHHRD